MRDRLGHLQAVSMSNGTVAEHETAQALPPSENTNHDDPPQDTSANPDMEAVFDEAQEARRQIQYISLEVKRLRDQNLHIFTGAVGPSVSNTCDSNAIAAGIKTSAQEMLAHLRKMDAHGKELEEKYGVNSPVARIARTQYASVSNSFRDTMVEYNDAEMSHRESCKAYIQRQMEIVGREVTGDQIEEMLESGQWNVFSENMVSEGKTARSALIQIESRHTEMLQLERRIQSLHEVFLDVAMLLEEQSSMIDYIHTNVQSTEVEVREVLVKLERAKRLDRSNPFKKIFFWKR
ncbi:syntaxin-11b.2 [Megalobrama amblycephala]|uniref:syntaxin-11b.2 n=1 Tax=Megalobrama amblycephala TaxID=75352 RepID=UPI00201430D1|nr:syntaxin-11b.2 [Megalobrama amblycephala]XP_048062430.1 syntaxin-11b.2 [Megalobrama amblycephala]XP_048062431.1 syntaxin-11b.2 [Megalobrama amblycephala]